MAIKTISVRVEVPVSSPFPVLREHINGATHGVPRDQRLVVLFISPTDGIPLQGVQPSRIGKKETWIEFNKLDTWVPTSITITSEN